MKQMMITKPNGRIAPVAEKRMVAAIKSVNPPPS
jgi:hypothetical protein